MRILPAFFVVLSLICFGCTSAPVQVKETASYKQSGKASYYADKFQGRSTASGEPYDKKAMTGAHRKLPFGTRVRVTNIANGKSVIVRINDRGPFTKGRVIDLSRAAFSSIGNTAAGILFVTVEIID
ncbi:septal ring lytic transglycosylase RlpA family protein [Maridesulfovibrio sp.]|uniref:septal ring lytic transglycosylase RlpA family protein n=1 Tax=Maridesulfovibrio sp. TaxID=2795000 RepID=UPI0029CA603C|nr:septal ring lytic transglycosylase RlpA family protein [Maridesulfovibrio sp.]